jgi:hypothetical protein
MCIKINKIGKQEVEIWWVQKRFPRYGVPIWRLWPNIRCLPSSVTEKNATKNILDGRKDGRTKMRQKCHNNIIQMYNYVLLSVFISVTPNIFDKNCEILILYFRLILWHCPHSWLITWLVVTRRARHVERELPTLQEHFRFPWF